MKAHSNTEVLSFRHHLIGALARFLGEHRFGAPGMPEHIAEGIVALAHYREEGAALFPAMFFCHDRDQLLAYLGGSDPLAIGTAPLDASAVRRALKQCASLCSGSWAIYLKRTATQYEYGVFRADDFVLHSSFMARLREVRDDAPPIVGALQLADDVIEVRMAGGAGQLVHLSGARTDGTPVMSVYAAFTRALTADVDVPLRAGVGTFFKRVLIDAVRGTHGCLIAVLPPSERDFQSFRDGVLLDEPLDVPARVAAYMNAPSIETRAAMQSLVPLVAGMLAVDGITLLGSNGTVIGYNVFLEMPAITDPLVATTGGARQRTFRALSSRVGSDLRAAFVRSQDGFADCVVDDCVKPA